MLVSEEVEDEAELFEDPNEVEVAVELGLLLVIELEELEEDFGLSTKGSGTKSGLIARAAKTPAPPVRTNNEIPVRSAFFCKNASACCSGVIVWCCIKCL